MIIWSALYLTPTFLILTASRPSIVRATFSSSIAVEQVAAQAADRQPAVEVLVGLLDDVAAEPVAEPGGLRRHHRGRAGADHQHER